MSDLPSRLVFTVLPCLVAAYAAAVFLTTRPISATRAWTLGLVIASLLTLGAAAVMGPLVSVWTDRFVLLRYGRLYFIPTVILVATALGLRSRGVGRNAGIVVLVALFLATAWIARYSVLFGLGDAAH